MTIRDENGNIEWIHTPIVGPTIVVHARNLEEASEKIDTIYRNRRMLEEREKRRLREEAEQADRVKRLLPIVRLVVELIKLNDIKMQPEELIIISEDGVFAQPDEYGCAICDWIVRLEDSDHVDNRLESDS